MAFAVDCVASIGWPMDPASHVVSSPKSLFSSRSLNKYSPKYLLRRCWAVACLWLSVLLPYRQGHFWSDKRFGRSVFIREDALVRTVSFKSGMMVLLRVEVSMEQPDGKRGMTFGVAPNGPSRKKRREQQCWTSFSGFNSFGNLGKRRQGESCD